MLDDDELQALAEDIRDFGQHQPIVLDADDRILDGRSRLKACEIVGIEPIYVTYDGDNPTAYALGVNSRRRHLTKGQLAMIAAMACPPSEHPGRPLGGQSVRSLSEQAGVSTGRIGQASMVLRYAPHLADAVIKGATGLNEAYATAQENKAKENSAEAQLARLREEDPELADRVVEGDLTLAGAWAERTERVEEDKRQRKVATRLLDELVPPLAQTRGTRTFSRYDPAYATGAPLTREIIAHAMTALAEMDQVWQERDLP